MHIRKHNNPGWKRALDLCGVVVVTPLLAPVLIAVAVYIKLVSRGPILFVQSRVGYGGEAFRIYKFRTMHVSKVSRDEIHRDYVASRAGVDQPLHKPDYRNDLIPGGELLRRLSIDEFPQLINVMQGNMSLVGPRPDVMQLDDYQPWQLRRFEVLPGMTGLWQVSGKNRLTLDQMIALDIEYIETRCLWKDIRILARTVFVLLLDRNE
jgi:lipopolysaccharide/colanic/teichoic acid biosynthesis glycosyltransferase